MLKTGILASVETAAIATALGVKSTPVRMSTFSRVTSSPASRRATSGAGPVVSRRTISTLRPATLSPWRFMNNSMAASTWAPASANGPEKQ
jgi:hypothetical protein